MGSSNKAHERRSYDQYCAVARALDVIGERWSLLLVRELLLGPKRYKDLLAALPGIGTNLLARRLREMEGLGIVQRTVLPPPAGSAVYELTESGQALEPAMRALGRWGARFLGQRRATDVLAPGAYFITMRGAFKPEAAKGVSERYEVRVDGRVFEVAVQGGRCVTREGRTSDPDAVLEMDVETLNDLLFEGLAPSDALASSQVQVKGDQAALERFVRTFTIRGHGAERVEPRKGSIPG